jgi:hypothetical protein
MLHWFPHAKSRIHCRLTDSKAKADSLGPSGSSLETTKRSNSLPSDGNSVTGLYDLGSSGGLSPLFGIIFKKPVHQTPGNVFSAFQRLYTVSIDSAEVSHAALIILFDTLSSPEALLVGNALTIFKNSSRDGRVDIDVRGGTVAKCLISRW